MDFTLRAPKEALTLADDMPLTTHVSTFASFSAMHRPQFMSETSALRLFLVVLLLNQAAGGWYTRGSVRCAHVFPVRRYVRAHSARYGFQAQMHECMNLLQLAL